MSHVSKVVILVIVVLVSLAGVAIAADPKKVPPKLSPSQTPPATYKRPDLVPMKPPGWLPAAPGGLQFECWSKTILRIRVWMMNTGTATAGSFKTVVSVNGVVWNVPNNPHTELAGLPPGGHYSHLLMGPAPGPGPIPGKVLVSVKVDSENTVVELNETNNVATVKTLPCGAGGYPGR
jgi:hypothetical protein